MDAETREFLEKIATGLEKSFERRIAESEHRILAQVGARFDGVDSRIDGVATLAHSANRRDRTRDLRMLAIESRFAEFEQRLIKLEGE